jgi:hypothetical protein
LLNHGVGYKKDELIDIPEGFVLISQMRTLQALVDEGAAAFSKAHWLLEEVPPSQREPPHIWSSPAFPE